MLNYFGYKCSLGGNIGRSLLSVDLFDVGAYVVEVSSFQAESLHFAFDYASLLNLTPDHLDRHKTMDNYLAAKSNLVCNAGHSSELINFSNVLSFYIKKPPFVTNKSSFYILSRITLWQLLTPRESSNKLNLVI